MPPSIPSSFNPHQILAGRFELLALLGRGGMGEVWLTRDRELEVRIALKLMHPRLAAAEDAVAFMKNECRAARRLTHPNIVRVFDFHLQDDLAFISMEWVEGPTFDRWQPSARDEDRQRIQVLSTVAAALDDIHRQGLVHRDVKARNILMTPAGQPKLADFGIVGLWRLLPGMLNVQSGGSYASMSPQQREGRAPHPADDIYALGVLLQATLTDAPPDASAGETAGPTDTQRPDFELPLPSAGRASDKLRQLAVEMQATERSARPASMAVVREAIDTILTTGVHRTTPPETDQSAPAATLPSLAADHIAPQPYKPGPENSAASNRQQPMLWGIALVVGAIGLMTAGIWFIGYLAKQPPTTTAPPAAETTEEAAVTPPPSENAEGQTARPAAVRSPLDPALETAEKNIALWLRVSDRLKAAQTTDWAPDTLATIEARAQAADAAMMAKDFAPAAEAYAEAVAAGEALLAEREPRYAAAMAQGAHELQADRPVEARTHFDLALKIKPADERARQGLAAAAKREKVLALMDAGQAHEIEERYDLAMADYEGALKLEPDFAPARAAVERLRNQVAEIQYNHLVSEGLRAFYQNNLEEARGHIQAALQYQPGGQEAREALRQIDTAAREQRIAQLRRRARSAEDSEQWDRALKAYENALALDPALQFARRGAARSRARVRLDKRLRYYLDHPEALASDRYLTEARQLLQEVEALEPRGPRLAGQIQTLKTGVQAAQTIIPVTLLSDGLTDVAVLRVARLGRITRRTLELRPGIYTIVGARDGYKDVRQTIRVEADQQALQVSIVCKEKI